ncbi:MAG: excinuclease ABC subunit B [Campylobacteraceae bacterium 4484_166]|nr:MAG: excinuclease ABC subunit B [Campylobacteraceae bacterium 4484_166]
MERFKLKSNYKPAGDQPKAIDDIVLNIQKGNQYTTLHGVTGSGKTYTMAKVIEKLQLPTLIMTHNKTLAAQLYSEFRGFFPKNHVEYFISYYDYYQPEAYIPRQDLFIEKDSSINEELERLRLSTTASLLSFDDIICVASVSANYGLGNPDEYRKNVQLLELNQSYSQRELLLKLVDMGYKRDDNFFDRSNFKVTGDVIDIFPAYFDEEYIRVEFFGDEVDKLTKREYLTNKSLKELDKVTIYSVNPFVVSKDRLAKAIDMIETELDIRLKEFQAQDKLVEYQRLKSRVEFDLEMLQATGMCKGIENYARLLTDKKPGETPYSLLDYFQSLDKPFLLIVDESHVSLSQFRGMYKADRSRKEVLVDYGFRLPSAMDNRPLMFEEFIKKADHYLFVSATPAPLELDLSSAVASQVIRPTGLLDPTVEIINSTYQVEKLFDEIKKTIEKGDRVLVTVLTKKLAEQLTSYYQELGIKVKYMHSDIDAIQRNHIIRELRVGKFDVLIGINLLREGLDIPETSLVAVMDADKEGFLRSRTSLIQTMGRTSRHKDGRVILFATKITDSMQYAIDITNERRAIQIKYNKKHGITPTSTKRVLDKSLKLETYDDIYNKKAKIEKLPANERKKMILELNKAMSKASRELNFEEAIRLRDEIEKIKKI